MPKEHYDNYHEWLHSSFQFKKNKRSYEMFANYFKKNYLKHMPTNKDARIFEIATGMGQFLYFLKKEGYTNVEGLDLDADNVKLCHELGFPKITENDMYDILPTLEDDSYDLIVMNDLIEHVEREKTIELLSTIRKKLKKGGKLILKTVNCNNVYGISSYFGDFTHVTGYTAGRIMHVGLLSGYSHSKSYNLYLYPNVPVIDPVFKLIAIWYAFKRLMFKANARPTENVFSKNLLAVLTK